ncbi:MAG TPA: HDOD domain-containing protein [Dissulfurispiraceae bacterium]|nr:HDOD domain-containing protein [Dissulfurispiraceae bacterium]
MKSDLEKIILDTIDIPSLPTVAMKALELINDGGSSINELEKIISQDQSFSARLLRIANSPYYGMNRRIDTISSGVMLIGFNTMKSLVVAASLKDMHRKFGLFEQKLWEHSLGVSVASSLLAKVTKMLPPEEALVGGLIHDVGKTILNNSIPDKYALISQKVYEEGKFFRDVETELLGYNHCDVGGLIARKWKLPKNLEAVIQYHHSETLPVFEDNAYEALCQIVNVSDAACLSMSIGIKGPENVKVPYNMVGLDEAGYSKFLEMFKANYAEQKAKLTE